MAEEHVKVSPGDIVTPSEDTGLSNDLLVKVNHALHVTVVDDNDVRTIATFDQTVGQMLADARIQLGTLDQVSEPLNAKLYSGMNVTIARQFEDVRVSTKTLPFDTVRHADDSAMKGEERIVSNGHPGEEKIVTTTLYRNGKPVSTNVKTTVVQQPADKVVAYGTQDPPVIVASRGSEGPFSGSQITVVATAYVGGGTTATGDPARHGSVAVDPNVIPLGTKLYIPGYGYAVADDTGGAIRGNRVDLCFDSEQQALDFGRQTVTIQIVH